MRSEVLAHRWVREVFRPTVRAVPGDLREGLDPAGLHHELPEHRRYLSQRAQHEVALDAAAADFLRTVAARRGTRS